MRGESATRATGATGASGMPENLRVQLSFAAFPALFHSASARQFLCDGGGSSRVIEPAWGEVHADHVQLVPQNQGQITHEVANDLRTRYPKTRFRLHANARVQKQMAFVDVSEFHERQDWVRDAAAISRVLGAPAYSAHSGLRRQCSFDQMLDNARRAEDLFEVSVAIEGQYPSSGHNGDLYLVSTWEEYRKLNESGCADALHLSHLNILVQHSGRREDALVSEMLSNERCLEVHVSSNDGTGDQHQVCTLSNRRSWWWPLLRSIHGQAVVFTEGNQLRKKPLNPPFKPQNKEAP